MKGGNIIVRPDCNHFHLDNSWESLLVPSVKLGCGHCYFCPNHSPTLPTSAPKQDKDQGWRLPPWALSPKQLSHNFFIMSFVG